MPATMQHDTAHALPAELTSFIGRRHEIGETRRVLGVSHLVTLTGSAGVGKTRLALRAAGSLQGTFPDGVSLVELAEVRDPALLAPTLAARLGVTGRSARAAVDLLVDHLAPRRFLLVLDTCEHLVDPCARLVESLLRACPDLRILATSRQSLGVCGEATLRVPPLPVPEAQPAHELETCEAVRLFVDRAHAVVPAFRLDERNTAGVARLCQALEGIPLAIELAAVRLRVLSLDQLEDRLHDRYRLLTAGSRSAPARQQTLRAAIDWSYALCSPEEQLLWGRLSVFSGGFDLEDAENVCLGPCDGRPVAAGNGTRIERDALLDLLDALVDKSVIGREEYDGRVRYALLETIREYGLGKLREAGSAEHMRRRHRNWFDRLTAAFEREWLGPRQADWLARVGREHANIRLALDYCVTTPGDARTGLRMATRLDDYWGIRGQHAEVRRWLEGALAAEPRPSAERVSGLRMSGWFALLQGDIAPGQRLLAQAGEAAERLGDQPEAAYVQHARGTAALLAGDLDGAEQLLLGSLQGFRAAGLVRGELFALLLAGLTIGARGDSARGLALLDECVALSTRLREVFWRSCALWARACFLVITSGENGRAAAATQEALRHKRQLGDMVGLAVTVDTMAWVSERQGHHERAAVLLGAAHSLREALAALPAYYITFAGMHDEHSALTRSALGDGAFEAAFREGREMGREAALDYALEEGTGDAGTEPHPADVRRPAGALTRRERQIAERIAEGMTNREIAQSLVIAVRTAEGHVEHILSKLGFTSRAQIAAWVTGQRLGERPPT